MYETRKNTKSGAGARGSENPGRSFWGAYWLVAAVGLWLLGATPGCSQLNDPAVPEPIHQRLEPESSTEYLLYAPSNYDHTQSWPLVVICHGAKPWDSPRRQIGHWVKLAEEFGFVVAAPDLSGTPGDFPPAADKQIQRQIEDERLILDVVRHIRGGYSISADWIFLTGWSGGSHAVLHTGLSHPDIFRALAILKGRFDSAYLTDVASGIDPYQPVYTLFSSFDHAMGSDMVACNEWLAEHGAALTADRSATTSVDAPGKAFAFFEKVVRQVPWLHLYAARGDGSTRMQRRFKAVGSFDPLTYEWEFGDGHSAPVATPTHTYRDPGTYTVTLVAGLPGGKQIVRRSLKISVP